MSFSRCLAATALAAVTLATSFSAMSDTPKPLLFKIVTVKDDFIVAVAQDEAGAPRSDAAAIGQALVARGSLTLWQYVTRKGGDGALEIAPRAKISVLAHDSLRVEPYTPAVRVVPAP